MIINNYDMKKAGKSLEEINVEVLGVCGVGRRSGLTSSKLKGPLLSLSAFPKYHSFSLSLFMSGAASITLL